MPTRKTYKSPTDRTRDPQNTREHRKYSDAASPDVTGYRRQGPIVVNPFGRAEVMTYDELLAMLLATIPGGIALKGYDAVITNGDPVAPEVLFDSNGDAIMGFVPTP